MRTDRMRVFVFQRSGSTDLILTGRPGSNSALKQAGILFTTWRATGKDYLIFQGLQLIFCLTRWPSFYKQMLMQQICANLGLASPITEARGMEKRNSHKLNSIKESHLLVDNLCNVMCIAYRSVSLPMVGWAHIVKDLNRVLGASSPGIDF